MNEEQISDVTYLSFLRLLTKPNPLVLTTENGASTLHYPCVLEPHIQRDNRETEVLTLKIVDPMNSSAHCRFFGEGGLANAIIGVSR